MTRRQTEEIHRSAPGKVILFGEHAVVYGMPAIAIPVTQVKAHAWVRSGRQGIGTVLHATNLGRYYLLDAAPLEEPLAYTCRTVFKTLNVTQEPDIILSLRSEIPIARGLGSGAATAAAVAKALTAWLGWNPSPQELSEIIYETEKIHHGTPSGIDNTVICFEQPVWFQPNHSIRTFKVGSPLTLLIADTGIHSSTRVTVTDIRSRWTENPEQYEKLFNAIELITREAFLALQKGNPEKVGLLMYQNHKLLVEMGVSSPVNDRLVEVARSAGALGAKLSGGGRGGNNIVLATEQEAESVKEALYQAGATQVFETTLAP